jgi:hypothetical protein
MKIKKGLFFNFLIATGIEGYIEFYVNSIINIQTIDFTYNGDIFGVACSIFSLTLIFIFLPLVNLWILFTKSEDDIY